MPRYLFHLVEGERRFRDENGRELPNLIEAHTVALDIISKCLRYIPDWPAAEAPRSTWSWVKRYWRRPDRRPDDVAQRRPGWPSSDTLTNALDRRRSGSSLRASRQGSPGQRANGCD